VAAGPVTSIAFDPTGESFATSGGQDGAVKLWFTSTLQQKGGGLSIDPGASSSAAFEPDGRSLVVIDNRGNAFTWPTSLADWEQRACTIAGRNFTHDEWHQFLGGRGYVTVCP
jgi:WD40 repeat protein